MDEEVMIERRELSKERLAQIKEELETGKASVKKPYSDYFLVCVNFMLLADETWDIVSSGKLSDMSMEELAELNDRLYEDVTEENYAESFANPEYAVKTFGDEYGKILCALYYELRRSIGAIHERDFEGLVIREELLLLLGIPAVFFCNS